MTDYPTGSPAAGWYTDPADASLQRWWGGSQWTHDTRPIPAQAAAPVLVDVPGGGINPFATAVAERPAQASTFGSSRPATSRGTNDFSDFNALGTSDFDAARGSYDVSSSWHDNNRRAYAAAAGTNGPATAGLVLSLLGLSLLGIIFSARGLGRARALERAGGPPLGRKRSRWGIGLGITSMVLGTALAILVITSYPAMQLLILERQAEAAGVSVLNDEELTDPGSPVTLRNPDGTVGVYNREEMEQAFTAGFENAAGAPLDWLQCPDEIEMIVGSSFTCTMSFKGGTHEATMLFVDPQGSMSIRLDGTLIN